MKIYRGPHSTPDWSLTDTKNPENYIDDWKSNRKICMDATIDKTGERHSYVGIEIDENDIVSLFKVLLERYICENENMKNNIQEIRKLVFGCPMRFSNKNLSKEELFEMVEEIKKMLNY